MTEEHSTESPAPETPACPKCASAELEKLLSLPAIKSETTHGLAMRAGRRSARFQQSEKLREQAEYEHNHND